MHRPGYVQGGQEANRGYLLLGIYHRRIPGDTVSMFRLNRNKQKTNRNSLIGSIFCYFFATHTDTRQ
jgi:hypothetical protein